jgi:hypothetical protein
MQREPFFKPAIPAMAQDMSIPAKWKLKH